MPSSASSAPSTLRFISLHYSSITPGTTEARYSHWQGWQWLSGLELSVASQDPRPWITLDIGDLNVCS